MKSPTQRLDPELMNSPANVLPGGRALGSVVASIEAALSAICQAPIDEKELQSIIAQQMDAAGIQFEREVQTASGPVDFAVEGIAIEVKIKGSALSVTRQLLRYLADDRFSGGILITTKPMELPMDQTPDGKQITVISLWKNFL